MKQMHNLRLVAANPIQLCRYDILGGEDFGHEDDWLPRSVHVGMYYEESAIVGKILLQEATNSHVPLLPQLIWPGCVD